MKRVGQGILGAGTVAGTAIITKRVTDMVGRPGPEAFGPEPGGGAQYFERGSSRRYRRMNPMNVRALRRSIRRVDSAQRLLKKMFVISGGKITPRFKKGGH